MKLWSIVCTAMAYHVHVVMSSFARTYLANSTLETSASAPPYFLPLTKLKTVIINITVLIYGKVIDCVL